MTIYIHFGDKTRELNPIRLHNVASVHDDGVYAVRVRMMFSDANPRFEGVSHVAIQTEKSGS
jgi:hypothetical protein